MNMHRSCCCLGTVAPGGPAVFISLGPDEDSWANYVDTLDLGDCNPFCLMNEDVIHPKVDAAKYGIDNEFVDDDGMVRLGLELLLVPSEGNYGPPSAFMVEPQCYDLTFERFEFTRVFEDAVAVQRTWDLIHERYGEQILEDGSINPFPTQIWFMVDDSGSYTWTEGEPIVRGLYDKFKDEYGEEVAQYKFNPCFDGPGCVSWGCCGPADCESSPCFGGDSGEDVNMLRYAYKMTDENFMSTIIDLMRAHFVDTHCDPEKISACGDHIEDCWGCQQCGFDIPCQECLGFV